MGSGNPGIPGVAPRRANNTAARREPLIERPQATSHHWLPTAQLAAANYLLWQANELYSLLDSGNPEEKWQHQCLNNEFQTAKHLE